MTILSLYVLLAIASSLGPRHGVGARGVPDVSLSERRAERSDPHVRTLLLNPTCKDIKNSISNASAVYTPGTPEYLKDIGAFVAILTHDRLSLLMRPTQQNTGLVHRLNMPRVRSNQGMCKTFLLSYVYLPLREQCHTVFCFNVRWFWPFSR